MSKELDEGIRFFNQKNYEKVVSLFSSLGDKAAEDEAADVAYYTGLSYAKLGKTDEAMLFLEQVVTCSQDEAKVRQCRMLLAVLYAKTGRLRLADFELQKLVEAGEKNARVYSALAFTAWEQNEPAQSEQFYEKALELDADNPTALNGLGYVLASLGKQPSRAMELIKKALQSKPNSPAFLDSLGWAYYKMGLVEEAKKFLTSASEILPGNETILSHLHEVNAESAKLRKFANLSK